MEDKKMIHEGLVIQSFPNAMFHVLLDNQTTVVLGYISGKMRRGSIRILTGDRVKIEISRYDATKGRIIFRLPRVDNSDNSEDED
uniref:translation initiation factor 1 n=1 Tax=Cleistocactus hyalacanthus TaxID=2893849 RepID=UPI0030038AF3|nr:translation initiation factor 1 [Cleistocactus hyalacanthus]